MPTWPKRHSVEIPSVAGCLPAPRQSAASVPSPLPRTPGMVTTRRRLYAHHVRVSNRLALWRGRRRDSDGRTHRSRGEKCLRRRGHECRGHCGHKCTRHRRRRRWHWCRGGRERGGRCRSNGCHGCIGCRAGWRLPCWGRGRSLRSGRGSCSICGGDRCRCRRESGGRRGRRRLALCCGRHPRGRRGGRPGRCRGRLATWRRRAAGFRQQCGSISDRGWNGRRGQSYCGCRRRSCGRPGLSGSRLQSLRRQGRHRRRGGRDRGSSGRNRRNHRLDRGCHVDDRRKGQGHQPYAIAGQGQQDEGQQDSVAGSPAPAQAAVHGTQPPDHRWSSLSSPLSPPAR